MEARGAGATGARSPMYKLHSRRPKSFPVNRTPTIIGRSTTDMALNVS